MPWQRFLLVEACCPRASASFGVFSQGSSVALDGPDFESVLLRKRTLLSEWDGDSGFASRPLSAVGLEFAYRKLSAFP